MKCIATINWTRSESEEFVDGNYSRIHQWVFDGGMQINASASPGVVPLPMSDPSLIDPEEAFVASISACHMLFFLSICAKHKYAVTDYEDTAVGLLGETVDGKKQMISVALNPITRFDADKPPPEEILSHLHELAHESCFIANSVKTKIEVVLE